ncbi:MAG: hypothetical protein JNK85_27685 [Verrucomicrobiales bacterium]|nr:hypothetical protein [Verrucomicrobiales bacterium]
MAQSRKRGAKATTAASVDSSGMVGAGITEAAVRKATGKGWGEWFNLLDEADARELTHHQIMEVIGRYEAGEWWQQMITVAYEQARGLRLRHPKDDGFSASASKAINAGVTRVYGAWTEDSMRCGWLDATGWHIRKATPCKSLRATWKDGKTHVEVHLWPRGVGRTLVQVEHSKLVSFDDVSRFKAFWGVALERLREYLESADQPHSLAA